MMFVFHKRVFLAFLLSVIFFSLTFIQLVRADNVFVFNHNLQIGSISPDVKELQKFLNISGYIVSKTGAGSLGKETTKFGSATKSALIKFQKANKITPAVGYFGPITRNVINKRINNLESNKNNTLELNTNLSSVNQNNSQSNLSVIGGYYSISGNITGIVGPVTLQNNGKDDIIISIGNTSNFTFSKTLASGSNYNITAKTNYPGQVCYLSNNVGTVRLSNITDIKVGCGAGLRNNPFTFVPNSGSGRQNVVTYSLTYTAGTNGSITGTTPQTINHGSNGTAVTATPNTGYSFTTWSDAVLTAERTDTNITTNKAVSASFAINTFTVTSTAGSNGAISPLGATTTNYGSNLTYTITPDANYHIDDVLVDSVSVGTSTSYTFTNVTTTHTISATFAIDTHTLTYTANSNGSITGTTPQTINHGSNGTAVTATPNTGYSFTTWSDAVLTAERTDTNITTNKAVSASFAINTFTVTSTAGSNGAISPLGATTTNYGSNLTYTITPDANYHIDDVLVDSVSVGTSTSYTFTNVTTTHTISATFAIDTHIVTFDKNGGDTEASPTTKTANYNDNVGTLPTAPTRTGYTFASWNTQADGEGTLFDATTAVTDNLTVYAKWTVAEVVYALRDTGPGGGLVFYDKGSYSGDPSWRYLEAAPSSTEWSGKTWGFSGVDIAGSAGTAVGTGFQNTIDFMAAGSAGDRADKAATLCDGLTSGGKTDWFLPSKDELDLIFDNLRMSNVGGFAASYYRSSSESGASNAWYQSFNSEWLYGNQINDNKGYGQYVRAVRAF